MNIIVRLKETCISVIPIMLIVFILDFTFVPVGFDVLVRFFLGALLLIAGLTVFLVGSDIGIIPIGRKAGAALAAKRDIPLLISVSFAVGFFITIVEPDVQVLAVQISSVDSSIQKVPLVLIIAAGIGFFVAAGLLRVIFQFPYRFFLIIFYGIVFICAFFTGDEFLAVAFDAGGATTGPMTVPFIIALGTGVASSKGGAKERDNSFGLTGAASIGPILTVLILGMIFEGNGTCGTAAGAASAGHPGQYNILIFLPEVASEIFFSFLPVAAMFIAFRFTIVRMPPYQTARMIKGLLYTYIGLVLFMTGVKGGFMSAGAAIGAKAGSLPFNYILIPLGILLGAVVVCAEPAVWVLNEQIEEISGGYVKKRFMLVFLSIGISVSVGVSMLRVLTGISIWWFLIPGYSAALLLSFFTPKLFTAVAFDSGGVASGPMTSTFILSFTLGASSAVGGDPVIDAFGVIAMVSMAPLITIQILGLVLKKKEKEASRLKYFYSGSRSEKE